MRHGRRMTGTIGAIVLAAMATIVFPVADPTPPAAEAASPIPLAVAARWEMNETGGSTMNDSGPNNLDGNVGDEVALNGSSYGFDINSPTAEYRPEHIVTVQDDDRLDPGTSDYAIEFRYRTTKSWGNVVQKGQNTTLGGYWKFEQPFGQMTCLFKWTNPANPSNTAQIGVQAPPDKATNDNQWHTIRCELRRDFGVILFIDGVEAAKNSGSLPAINNNKVVSIGGKSSCDQITVTCDYFDGDIDYVRIEKGEPAENQPPNMEFTYSCDKLTCSFNSSQSDDADGNIVSRSWEFGDGEVSTSTNPSHTYAAPGEYTVKLTGIDNNGAVGAAEETFEVFPNVPPVADFTVTCDVLKCALDASASSDSDGKIDEYIWDYGDGDGRTDDDPKDNHTYDEPGVYTVTLTVRDDDGDESTASKDVPVDVHAPAASFTVSCTHVTCAVDASGSTDSDGTITSYAWTFGDGAAGSGVTSGHTYGASGTYTIGLSVTDDDGLTTGATRSVTVTKQQSLPPGPPSPTSTRLVPVVPERLFDTRAEESAPGPKGLVAGGTTIDVQIAGVGPVPANATAVAINLTAVGLEPGFVTAWPKGSTQPTASNLNIVAPGQVRANLAIVPLGTGGMLSLFTLGDAHLLGDVAGYFVPQTTATSAGRIVTQSPERLFDTRPGPDPGPKGTVAANTTIDVPVLGEAGVPLNGVRAVVLNLTTTGAQAPGFVTAWDGEDDRPTASSLNVNTAGETVPNQVIVPVSSTGTIRLYASMTTELLADVSGWVTDGTAPSSLSGLFVPLQPERLFDTRPGEAAAGPKGLVPAGGTITPEIAGVAGVPGAAGAVVVNITMIGTAPSFASAWPAGATRPETSIVNVDGAGDVRANSATIALGDNGDLSLFASSAAHLLADVSGYLLA